MHEQQPTKQTQHTQTKTPHKQTRQRKITIIYEKQHLQQTKTSNTKNKQTNNINKQ